MANWNQPRRLLDRLMRVRSLGALLKEVGLRKSGRLAATASFLSGFAIGAGAGVLLAPASGEQSRRFLRGQLQELAKLLRDVGDPEPRLASTNDKAPSKKTPRRSPPQTKTTHKPNGRKRPGRASASS